MGRSVLAVIAVAALGIALVAADGVSAGASGASRGSGAAASGFRSGHGGFACGTCAGRHGAWHGRAAVRRGVALGRRHRGVIFRSAGFADPGFYESGFYGFGSGGPGCIVQRVQIDDDYGWRVRDVVVCPPAGLGPQAGGPSAPRARGSHKSRPPPIEE
jgi:hypothetical protein